MPALEGPEIGRPTIRQLSPECCSTDVRAANPGSVEEKASDTPHSLRPKVRDGESNFSRWFGDSKVLASQGKPLVVYHGTGADIRAFSPGKIGSVWGADAVGFFFTDDPEVASSYAVANGPTLQRFDGANIIPAYLCISRPVTVEALEAFVGESGLAARFDDPVGLMDEMRDEIVSMLIGNDWDGWSITKNSMPSINNTHDGVLLSFKGVTLAVAVDPRQIKSAIGNHGQFSPYDPDITHSQHVLPLQADHRSWQSWPMSLYAEGDHEVYEPVDRPRMRG